jgi:hypothetical protein
MRRAPRTVAEAANMALDRFLEVPRRVASRFYDEYQDGYGDRRWEDDRDRDEDLFLPRLRRRVADRYGRRARPSGISRPERRILDLVEEFLDEVPGDGARVNRVIDHVVLETDYDRDIVASVIRRNYVESGQVISKKRVVEDLESKDSVVDYMRDKLKDRGYKDLRTDVELTGLPDLDDKAELVAYDGDRPLVLCYPVSSGDVDDAASQEAAIFQASAIAEGQTASLVWVSDGDDSYVYDMLAEKVLNKLPKLSDLKAEAKSETRGAHHPKSET